MSSAAAGNRCTGNASGPIERPPFLAGPRQSRPASPDEARTPSLSFKAVSLTIPKRADTAPSDPATLALGALVWVLEDESRAQRFLDLTGIAPDELRASAGESATLGAVLDFLTAHEPDLVGAADALGVVPTELAAARDRIGA